MSTPLPKTAFRSHSVPLPELAEHSSTSSSPTDFKTSCYATKFFDFLPGSPSFPFFHLFSTRSSSHSILQRMPSIPEDILGNPSTEKSPEAPKQLTLPTTCYLPPISEIQAHSSVWKAFQRGAPIPLELLNRI